MSNDNRNNKPGFCKQPPTQEKLEQIRNSLKYDGEHLYWRVQPKSHKAIRTAGCGGWGEVMMNILCWLKHRWVIGYMFDPTNDRKEYVTSRVCERCMKLEYRRTEHCFWRDVEKAKADRAKYQIRMEKYWSVIERRREQDNQRGGKVRIVEDRE